MFFIRIFKNIFHYSNHSTNLAVVNIILIISTAVVRRVAHVEGGEGEGGGAKAHQQGR